MSRSIYFHCITINCAKMSHIRKCFDFSKNKLRCIHSTCSKFEEQAEYKRGKIQFKENALVTTSLDRFSEKYEFSRWDLSFAAAKGLAKKVYHRRLIQDQEYNPKRVEVLGPDLAIAHFVTHRRGIVKFVGRDTIFTYKNKSDLPPIKDESFLVEAVDTSKMRLVYEGLNHFKDLKYLKSVSFRGNLDFDNWCMDRISHLMPQVEYLNIAFCKNVDHNGLASLYRMRNLKCLNVEGISDSLEFQLFCLTIEAENPNLNVLGIVKKPKPKSAFDVD